MTRAIVARQLAVACGESCAGTGVDKARTEVLWSNRPIGHAPSLFDQDR